MGNLNIPGYPLPWEEEAAADAKGWEYASNLAKPLDICIQVCGCALVPVLDIAVAMSHHIRGQYTCSGA